METKPTPLFDTLEHFEETTRSVTLPKAFAAEDFQAATHFLQSYDGSQATFNAYRREVERLLHWSWLIQNKPVTDLRRADIEAYLEFCQEPEPSWIGTQKVPRFISQDGYRKPNPEWHPFVVTLTKVENRSGKKAEVKNYTLSQTALREIFAILSSFYNFLIQEEIMEINPVAHIRQKSKFLRKRQGKQQIRRLSELQWEYVIETAEKLAADDPIKHERTLFIMTALFSMYLRISELAASERWTPRMADFHRDHDGLWWFTTVGKGNKERQIAVSNKMLEALKRYRQFLGLPVLPTPADNTALLPKNKGRGPITDTSYIRKIVQFCFDQSVERMRAEGLGEDAESLGVATVHWLRHTGISEDVKTRPREHVRDDAGHSSSAITDKYIDIELRERHASAKNKPIKITSNED